MAAQLRQHVGQHLRLDAEHDDLAEVGRLVVVRGDVDAILHVQLLAALGVGIRADDVVGANQPLRHQSLDHCLGHDAGADKG